MNTKTKNAVLVLRVVLSGLVMLLGSPEVRAYTGAYAGVRAHLEQKGF